jgi:hypothetical protein
MSDPSFSDPEINRTPSGFTGPEQPTAPQYPPPPPPGDGTGAQPATGAQYPPPPVYIPPAPQPPSAPMSPANGMGLTALVLGISGLATSWIPFLGCLGLIAGVLAIVFGALGLGKANRGQATNRSSAVAGLATGILAVVVSLAAAMAFWSLGDPERVEFSDEGAGDTGESDVDESADGGEPAEAAEEPEGVGDGQWEVGTEIQPGTYVTTADSILGCYVERLSGFSGEFEDIIANTFIADDARGRFTIAEDDAGVEFSGGCDWVPATEATLAAPGDEVGPGFWEVGTEVRPGTYVTQAEEGILDGCYVARLAGFSLEVDDVLANEFIEGGAQGRIEIADSDAGVEFSGDCVWTLE